MKINSKKTGALLTQGIQEATRDRPLQRAGSVDSRKRRHWLEILEWISLAGSVAGTVAVALSGQILNAAVGSGLALTISLSLVNRQRIELQNRQETEEAIADVRQVVKSLHYQFQKLAAHPNDIEPMHQTLYELGAVTERLETRVASSENVEAISVEVSLMRGAIFDLQSELQELAHRSVDVTSLQEQIDKINRRLEALPAPFEPRELYTKIADLERKNQEIVKPYLVRLLRQVKQLEQQNADLSSQLDVLTEQFYSRPELKQMQGLQGIVAQLVTNVDRLQNMPEAEKLSRAIANLSRKLDVFSEQFNKEMKPPQMPDISQGFAHLPSLNELQELQSVLEKLNQYKKAKAASQRAAPPQSRNGYPGNRV